MIIMFRSLAACSVERRFTVREAEVSELPDLRLARVALEATLVGLLVVASELLDLVPCPRLRQEGHNLRGNGIHLGTAATVARVNVSFAPHCLDLLGAPQPSRCCKEGDNGDGKECSHCGDRMKDSLKNRPHASSTAIVSTLRYDLHARTLRDEQTHRPRRCKRSSTFLAK